MSLPGEKPQPAAATAETVAAPAAEPLAQLLAPPLVVFLAALLAWWALAEGGYFADVLLPGVIAICAALAVITIGSMRAPLMGRRIALPGMVAAVALFLLAGWSALSALWSPAAGVALGDGLRIAGFALAFTLGGCIAVGSGGRRDLALVPLALAGLVAGAVTAVRLASGDDPAALLDIDGTLQAPLGYRNATAAFFLLAFFPAVGLAASRNLDWRFRALAGGTATLCAGFGVVCQSRATIPAFALAILVFVLASPLKLRCAGWSLLALAPAVLVIPAMLDLFSATTESGDVSTVATEMNAAGVSVIATSLAATVLSGLAASLGGRVPALGSSSPDANRRVLGVIVALIAAAVLAFVVAVGNPTRWVGDRIDEFRSLETPSFAESSTRFGLSAGTGRLDFWRVAVEQLRDDPLKGSGGGGFQYAYTQDREVPKDARDAHSFELEIGSELGFVGLGLVAVALIAAIAGVFRSRTEGWDASAVAAAALAVATYWLVHGSLDWLWSYPVVTAAMFATLGAAGAARLRAPVAARAPRPVRIGVTLAALAALAIAAVPPFLSERFVDRATAVREADPAAALEALNRAHRLNPLDEVPLLIGGETARRAGDADLARDYFDEATRVRPADWAAYFYLAVLDAEDDRAAALAELDRARALNPLEPCLRNLPTAVRCSSGRSA